MAPLRGHVSVAVAAGHFTPHHRRLTCRVHSSFVTRWRGSSVLSVGAGTVQPTGTHQVIGRLHDRHDRRRRDVDSDLSAYLPLLARLRDGARPQPDWSAIVDGAVQVWAGRGSTPSSRLPQLRFEPFDYQLRAARTVLRRMRGRGILADEVGLGKTIEAGLVLSELRMRGLADRVLVVVPAGLVDQWRDELERKFGLPTTIARSGSITCPRHWGGPAGHYRVARRRSPRSAAG